MAASSSGLGHWVFIPAIRGSNPLVVTMYIYVVQRIERKTLQNNKVLLSTTLPTQQGYLEDCVDVGYLILHARKR